MLVQELIDLLETLPKDQEIIKRESKENLLGLIEEKDYLTKDDFYLIRAFGRTEEISHFVALTFE